MDGTVQSYVRPCENPDTAFRRQLHCGFGRDFGGMFGLCHPIAFLRSCEGILVDFSAVETWKPEKPDQVLTAAISAGVPTRVIARRML